MIEFNFNIAVICVFVQAHQGHRDAIGILGGIVYHKRVIYTITCYYFIPSLFISI